MFIERKKATGKSKCRCCGWGEETLIPAGQDIIHVMVLTAQGTQHSYLCLKHAKEAFNMFKELME